MIEAALEAAVSFIILWGAEKIPTIFGSLSVF